MGRVLSREFGTVPAWHGNEPAACLPTSSLFSETAWFQLSAGSCRLAWSSQEEGAPALLEGLGVDRATPEFMPTSNLKGIPSLLSLA